jgi:hypothetical protein
MNDGERATTIGLRSAVGAGTCALQRLLAIALAMLVLATLWPATSTAQSGPQPPAASSLIIKLAPGLSAAEQTAVITRNGGTEVSSVPALRLHVVQVGADQLASVLASYNADAQVVRAEVDSIRRSDALPSDPLYSYQWALPKIDWDLVFQTHVPTASAVVAVLDTGIDGTHADLVANVLPGTSILDGSDGRTDPSGHGTMVAGIVAAQTDTTPAQGIAGIGYAGVRLMPVTVLDAQGVGRDSDIISGVIWAVDHGADVILMAFSNPGFSESLQEAIDYAWASNVVLVAAVGNDGLDMASFPAGDRGVIGVAATDAGDQPASFSNYGPSVFLAAPGTDILTTTLGNAYSTISGTSTSAAIVAGAAALLMTSDATLTNGVVVGRLARSADPAGTQQQTGNGRINVARAFSDAGTDFIQPNGAGPVGAGGPFVGPFVDPYVAAARSIEITFIGTGGQVQIGASTGNVSYATTGTNRCDTPPASGTGNNSPLVTINGTCTTLSSSSNPATVTVTALPDGTSYFDGWSNATNGFTSCNLANAACAAVLPGGQNNLTVKFTPKQSVTASVTASNKTYDGTTTATVATCSLTGVLPADAADVTCAAGAATFATASVANGKTVTATAITLSGAKAFKYMLSATTATTTADITPKNLTITGAVAQNKPYDGNASATVSFTAATLVGVIAPDAVAINSAAYTASFDNKNAGTSKPVTVSGVTLTGAAAANYTVAQPTGLTANITPKALTVSGVTAQNKTYDRTTTATLDTSGASLVGVIGADAVTLNTAGATGAFADRNVATAKPVTVTGLTLAGADAGNYTLTQPTGLTADITPKALTVTGLTAVGKTYDGGINATLSGTPVLNGVIAPDVVTLGGTALGAFNNKNAGMAKPVTVTNLTLAGTDAGNYTLTQPTGLTADITPKALTVTGLTAVSKIYDGNTNATLTGAAALGGVIAPDVVMLGGTAAGTFSTKNAGIGKPVTVTNLTLAGADAGNYTLTQPTGLTADITPKALTVTGLTAVSKIYDGTANATLTGTAVLNGVIAPDVVMLGGTAAGTFNNKNAGIGKPVTVTGLTLAGADMGNYSIAPPAGLTADITPKALTVTGLTAVSKIYDGNTNATLTGTAALGGVIAPDVVTLVGAAAGMFGDKNVGLGKPVTVTGLTLAGADAGNYSVTQPAGLAADITPASLAVSGVTAQNKTYDGTTAATLNAGAATLVGVLGGDAVTLVTAGASGVFIDANAGMGKTVIVSGFAIGGSGAGNYALTQPTAAADIYKATPAVVVVGGTFTYDALGHPATCTAIGIGNAVVAGACALVYNGNPAAPVAAASYAVAASFVSGNANYTNASGGGTITINPRPASVTPNPASKFAGNPDPPLTGTLGNFVASDGVTASYGRAAGEAAGMQYLVSATLSPAGVLGNYTITSNTAWFSIIGVNLTGPSGPIPKNTSANVTASFANTGDQAQPTCTFDWDDGNTTGPVNATSSAGTWSCTAPVAHTYTAAGVYEVRVRVQDANTGTLDVSFRYIVVYDPNGGFVTGGGWINSPLGAYRPNIELAGKANFGFVSKYQKGASIPSGETEFQFQTASFNFKSTVYEWLVIAGAKAQYKGSGTINGTGDYGFLLTATDGSVSGGGGVDKFRIKVWDKTSSTIIYDNAPGSDDIDSSSQMALGGGSIVVHK